MDNPAIRNLMLLWLVTTTEMGNKGGLYISQLAANENNEQADLANALNLSPATVAQVIKRMSDNLNEFQTVVTQFHLQAKATFPADYDGPFCPVDTDSLTSLVPAAVQPDAKRSN